MGFTYAQRREALRDARQELAALAAAHRDDLLKFKPEAADYEAPIQAARQALLDTKRLLASEKLDEVFDY